MTFRSDNPSLPAVLFLAFVLTTACSDEPGQPPANAPGAAAPARGESTPAGGGAVPSTTDPRADVDVARYRTDLLDLAFRAASAFPLDPYVKNRCRAQEQVFEAALEVGQPTRARRYLDEIVNWRKGRCLALLAAWLAEHGATDVESDLEAARAIADGLAAVENEQEWRRDAILAAIAQARLALGQVESAAEIRLRIAASESGRLDATYASRVETGDYAAQLELLDAAIERGEFDQVRNALVSCAHLFDRFYDDPERRAALRERVRDGYAKLPVAVRIELLTKLADFAIAHGDPETALSLVADAQRVVDAGRWLPEHHVPVMARLAALRHRAGQAEAARRELKAAQALFEAERDAIVDIFRADALVPLAEAWLDAEDPGMARSIYRLALEESTVNPNSRPRAEDLVILCCSMARHGLEPDVAIHARLVQLCEELVTKW